MNIVFKSLNNYIFTHKMLVIESHREQVGARILSGLKSSPERTDKQSISKMLSPKSRIVSFMAL